MKRTFIMAIMALILMGAQAQEKKEESKGIKLPAWINQLKISGYGMLQYQASTQEGAKSNSFNLRLARISLDGRVFNDWYWKVQLQVNGNTATLGSSPRIVDLFVEWQNSRF